MAPDCLLDSEALHAKASADTGLDVYLAALYDIGDMHGPGIVNFYSQLLQLLKNRLLLADLLTRHPEIHDIELLPPVVIAGLPRTGTTHLRNLLGAATSNCRLSPPATFRTLPYRESVEPFPLPAEAGIEPDPRRTQMDTAVAVMDVVMPHFRLMHEMTADHVHEAIQILANDFSTMLFETLAHVPWWRDRDVIGPERSLDIRFDDFMASELGVAEQVYALANEPVTDDARSAMAAYIAGHQRGRLGRVATSCEMFGLDENELRARFAPYVERFLA